jgi:hypothetical protein
MAAPTPNFLKEFANWLTPALAIEILDSVYGSDSNSFTSKRALTQRLAAGVITGIAEQSKTRDEPLRRYVAIARHHWDLIAPDGLFWSTGDATYYARDPSSLSQMLFRQFNIRFEPFGIEQIVASATPRSSAAAASAAIQPDPSIAKANGPPEPGIAKGGAPRKSWWDDFWIEICRQIYDNELKVETQADLERAMLQWVENHHDGDVGETTIKTAARKLFRAWKLGSKT